MINGHRGWAKEKERKTDRAIERVRETDGQTDRQIDADGFFYLNINRKHDITIYTCVMVSHPKSKVLQEIRIRPTIIR